MKKMLMMCALVAAVGGAHHASACLRQLACGSVDTGGRPLPDDDEELE